MKRLTIYTLQGCPYCIRAKKTLEELDVPYTEIDTNFDTPEMDALMKRTLSDTLPQIFIDDEFIGGSDDLTLLVNNGKFLTMLTSV